MYYFEKHRRGVIIQALWNAIRILFSVLILTVALQKLLRLAKLYFTIYKIGVIVFIFFVYS